MRFYLICIFLFGPFFQAFSNNFNADSLYDRSEYFEAAIAYERLIYYADTYKEKNEFSYKKALCYKALQDYNAAKKTLQKISLFGLSEHLRNAIIYETTIVSYLDEDYEACSKSLLPINFDRYNTEQRTNLYLVATLNYIMVEDFKKSEVFALKYAEQSFDKANIEQIQNQIKTFYTKKNLPKLKNEKVFEWISIVPGMGQLYVGEVGEGLTNIALNLSAFSFGVYQIINGFYFTGYFVGTLSINKIYFGGRTRAKNAFIEVNSQRLTNFNLKIRNELSSLK